MNKIKRIVITPGEPAGIGPDITLQLAQSSFPAELIVIADPEMLQERAQQLGLPIQLIACDFDKPAEVQQAGTLKILPIKVAQQVQAGKLDVANANYVLHTLEKAAILCQQKIADAVVTGPVNKEIMNKAGIKFSGHTEFFAHMSQVKQTVMLFVVNDLKVALATTHLPLANVSQSITKERLRTTLTILNAELKNKFKIATPNILVCGLNPHAGEGGYLGREEIDTITPLLNELRAEKMLLQGPLPADTLFTPKYLQAADAVLAMYHDQALPLVKYIGFGSAVNVTLGLPYVRTSVDHGTAIDIAGSGTADAGSMQAAVKLALELC